jgi:hypothetical protein
VKSDLDLSTVRAAIAADPWISAAIAFAAGACIALVEPRGRLARAITSAVGAMALAALREATMQRVASEARSWIDARRPPGAKPATA